MDDILLAGPKKSELIPVISAELAKVYTLTTDFEPKIFVGLVITRNRTSRSLTITQPHYVESLINKFSIPSSSAKYPMSEDFLTNMPLPSTDSLFPPDLQTLFQEKVGSILYLASQTRPDLLYSTTQLSRRSNKATARDMAAADRLLRYIASTPSLGITFCSYDKPFRLFAYVDASYNCYSDSKSHTGVSLHLGQFSGAFLSLSKKQTIVADSTTVSEFVATHTAVQKVLWAQHLLTELGLPSEAITTLYQDNKSTIRLIQHKGNSGRTKHIALRFHMIRDCVKNNNITIEYLCSEAMTADTLTKPLGSLLFPIHQARLLNTAIP